MHRRDFLHLLGYAGLALLIPPIELETPMELSDIWLKIANNAQLTPQEQDFLKMQGRETQMRNAFIAGNTSASGQLNVPTPFYPIFSETFATDKASITINIPTGYKHLMLFGTGRTTNSYGVDFKCRLNGDTGANYQYQNMAAEGTTVSASAGTAAYFNISFLSGSDSEAGKSSSFYAYINGYSAPVHKIIRSFVTLDHKVTSTSYFIMSSFTSVWRNTAAINSMEFYPDVGNLAAGSTLSVYGVF